MAEEKDQTAVYALGIAVLLASLLIAGSVYFSINGLADMISAKQFVAGGAAAAAPSAADTAANAAAQAAAAQAAKDAAAAAAKPAAPQNVALDFKGRPSYGPADAKVTVLEFSDFQCPYCERAYPTINSIKALYNNSVRVVFMQYPLPFHPFAQKAAEASECAYAQGKFWEMHDKMFTNQNALDVASLKSYASASGLDMAKFSSCLDNSTTAAQVNADLNAGQSAGVGGTPSFFIFMNTKDEAKLSAINSAVAKLNSDYQVGAATINMQGSGYGIFFAGALPLEAFKVSIDAQVN